MLIATLSISLQILAEEYQIIVHTMNLTYLQPNRIKFINHRYKVYQSTLSITYALSKNNSFSR